MRSNKPDNITDEAWHKMKRGGPKLPHIGGQNKVELETLVEWLKGQDIYRILEIGSRDGIVLRYMAQNLPLVAEVASIDMPNGPWGYGGSERSLLKQLTRLEQDGIRARYMLGDSKDAAQIRFAETYGPYDFIFIDGDHSYEGVLADYRNYGPIGRIVGFHDISHPEDSPAYGATKVWNEVRADRDEYLEIRSGGSYKGIGLML